MIDDADKFLDEFLGNQPKTPKAPKPAPIPKLQPMKKPKADIDSKIDQYASQNGVDPNFVRAVMGQESGGNPKAKSWANAKGLLQIIPETGKKYRKDFDPFNVDHNLEVGTKHLAYLDKKYKGDKKRVLAAYNAGEGNADKPDWYNQSERWSNDPAVQKGLKPRGKTDKTNTRNYIEKIMGNYEKMGGMSQSAEDTFLDSFLGTPTEQGPMQGGTVSPAEIEFATPENLKKYGFEMPQTAPTPTVQGTQTVKQPPVSSIPTALQPNYPEQIVPKPGQLVLGGQDGEQLVQDDDQANVNQGEIRVKDKTGKKFLARQTKDKGYSVTPEVQYSNEDVEAGYSEYLGYTKEPDTPETKQKYLNAIKGNVTTGTVEGYSGQMQPASGQAGLTQKVNDNYAKQVEQERSTAPAYYFTHPAEQKVKEIKTDADFLQTVAANVAIDISNKPSGMNLGEYLLRTALKANQPKYGYSDQGIERAVQATKEKTGKFTATPYPDFTDEEFPEAVNQFKRQYESRYVNMGLTRGIINDALGGNEKQVADALAIEKPQVVKEIQNPFVLPNSVNRLTEEEARQKTIEEIKNPKLSTQFERAAKDAATKGFSQLKGLVSPFLLIPQIIDDIKAQYSNVVADVPEESERIASELAKKKATFGSFADYQQIQQTRQDMEWGEYGTRLGAEVVRGATRLMVADSLKGLEVVGDFAEDLNPLSYILPDEYQPSVRNLGNLIGFTYARIQNPDLKYSDMPGMDSSIDKRLFYNIGKSVDEALGDDKYLRDTFGGALAQGMGSAAGFLLMGMVAPQASIGARFSLSSAALGGLTSMGSGYSEARENGLTETQSKTYALIMGLTGASEGFGVGSAVSRSIKNASLRKMFLYDLASYIKARGKNFADEGLEEFAQEFFQSTVGASSLAAIKDKEPDTYQRILNIFNRLPKQMGEAAVDAGSVAFLTGGIMGSTAGAIADRGRSNEGFRVDEKSRRIEVEGVVMEYDSSLDPTIKSWKKSVEAMDNAYTEVASLEKAIKNAKTPEAKVDAVRRLLALEKEVQGLSDQSARLLHRISSNVVPVEGQELKPVFDPEIDTVAPEVEVSTPEVTAEPVAIPKDEVAPVEVATEIPEVVAPEVAEPEQVAPVETAKPIVTEAKSIEPTVKPTTTKTPKTPKTEVLTEPAVSPSGTPKAKTGKVNRVIIEPKVKTEAVQAEEAKVSEAATPPSKIEAVNEASRTIETAQQEIAKLEKLRDEEMLLDKPDREYVTAINKEILNQQEAINNAKLSIEKAENPEKFARDGFRESLAELSAKKDTDWEQFELEVDRLEALYNKNGSISRVDVIKTQFGRLSMISSGIAKDFLTENPVEGIKMMREAVKAKTEAKPAVVPTPKTKTEAVQTEEAKVSEVPTPKAKPAPKARPALSDSEFESLLGRAFDKNKTVAEMEEVLSLATPEQLKNNENVINAMRKRDAFKPGPFAQSILDDPEGVNTEAVSDANTEAVPFEQFFEERLAENPYRAKYERNTQLLENFKRNQEDKWIEYLQSKAKTERLSDAAIDDFVAKFGEKDLFRTFRGQYEKGIEGWTPKDVRATETPSLKTKPSDIPRTFTEARAIVKPKRVDFPNEYGGFTSVAIYTPIDESFTVETTVRRPNADETERMKVVSKTFPKSEYESFAADLAKRVESGSITQPEKSSPEKAKDISATESEKPETAATRQPTSITEPDSPLAKARLNKELDKQYRNSDKKIVTRRQELKDGRYISKSIVKGGNYNRVYFNRLPSREAQDAYEKRLAEQASYYLDIDETSSIQVPKVIFDAVDLPMQGESAPVTKQTQAEEKAVEVPEAGETKTLATIQDAINNPEEAYKQGVFIKDAFPRKIDFYKNSPRHIYQVEVGQNGDVVVAYEKRGGSTLTFGTVYVQLNAQGTTKANGRQVPLERAYEAFKKSGQFLGRKAKAEAPKTEAPEVHTEADNDIEVVPVSQRVDVENLDGAEFTREEVAAASKTEKIRSKTGFTKTQEEWFINELRKAYDRFKSGEISVQGSAPPLFDDRIADILKEQGESEMNIRLYELALTAQQRLKNPTPDSILKYVQKAEGKEWLYGTVGSALRNKSLDLDAATLETHKSKLAEIKTRLQSARETQKREADAFRKQGITIRVPGDGTFVLYSQHGVDNLHKKLTGKTIEDARKKGSELYELVKLPKGYGTAAKEARIRQEDDTDITVAKANEVLGDPPATSAEMRELGVKQVSNGYWMHLAGENVDKFQFIIAPKPFSVNSIPGVEFFTSKMPTGWVVTEASTGRSVVTKASSANDAIASTLELPSEKVFEAIAKAAKENKLSPRYEAVAPTPKKEAPKPQATPTPEAVDVAEEATPAEPANIITDFGEKIGGAKKDVYKRLEQVSTDDIRSQPLSKSFPQPDYNQLIADGVTDLRGARLLKFFYDNIGAKPRKAYKLARYVQKVEQAIEVFKDILGNPNGVAGLEKSIQEKGGTVLARNYKHFVAIADAFGFPENPMYSGTYEITLFDRYAGMEGKGLYAITDGSYIISKDFQTAEEAAKALKAIVDKQKGQIKQVQFSVYQDRKTNDYFIGKKGAVGVVRLMENFKKLQEAADFLKNNQEQLETIWAGFKARPQERREANRPRVGTDWRKGKNVNEKEFAETFGFRAVEFGNWVSNTERQKSVNNAYDSLMDMASLLKIDPKAISLNGTLALAFGARGSGGKNAASAHFETDRTVINLTKTAGAGSLGHEWWHALDNYFARMRNEKDGFLTERPRATMVKESGMYRPDESIRTEMLGAFSEVVREINKSGMPSRAKALDRARTKVYWSTIIEMSARSFENYLIEKLAQNDQFNDYLANFKDTSQWLTDSKFSLENYPYPLKEETAINDAFDTLFATIEQEETDSGVMLKSVADIDASGIELQRNSKGEILAPNGKVSNIQNEGLAKKIRTPEFMEWFGDWESESIANQISEPNTAIEFINNGLSVKNDIILGLPIVQRLMLTLTQNDKVFRSIVGLIPVDVVNSIAGQKLPSDKTSGDLAVFRDALNAPIADKSIQSLSGVLTRLTTEFRSFLDGRLDKIPFPTLQTKDLSLPIVGRLLAFQRLSDLDISGRSIKTTSTSKRAENPSQIRLSVKNDTAELTRLLNNYSFSSHKDLTNNIPRTVSQVKDENGEPLVVYHGTGADFDTFNTKRKAYKLGAYFTNSPESASQFGKRGNVIPALLRCSKPLDASRLNYKEIANELKLADDAKRMVDFGSVNQSSKFAFLEDLDNRFNIVPKLKRKGHDGIIFDDRVEGKTYVVFNPNQIKSIFNEGTFSKDNDSILKKVADTEARTEQERLQSVPLSELLDGQASFDGNNVELDIKAAENLRRHMAELSFRQKGKEVDESAFDGILAPKSAMNNIVELLQETYDTISLPEYGYSPEEIAGHKSLLDAMKQVAADQDFGVFYVFEEALPEELFHKEDFMSGRTDAKALTAISESKLWNIANAKGSKFNRHYGKQSAANRLSELVAKLATGQEGKYGFDAAFDSREEFEDARDNLLIEWAEGILRNNPEIDLSKFERINKYVEAAENKRRSSDQPSIGEDIGSSQTGTGQQRESKKSDQPSDSRAEPQDENEDGEVKLRVPKYAEKSLDTDEITYEQESMKTTKAKGEALRRMQGIDSILEQVRAATGDLPGMMAALYQEQTRLNDLADQFAEDGKMAEKDAVLEQLAALSSDIVSAQIQSGRTVNIAKVLEPLSAENALNVITRLKQRFTGNENEGLSAKGVQEIKNIQSELSDTKTKLKRATRKIDKLREQIKTGVSQSRKSSGNRVRRVTQVQKAINEKLNANYQDLLAQLKLDIDQEIMKMVAWHGSPHVHDKFRMDKVGTGEGQQVYGYGLYFADREEVADWYRETYAPQNKWRQKDRVTGITLNGNTILDTYLAHDIKVMFGLTMKEAEQVYNLNLKGKADTVTVPPSLTKLGVKAQPTGAVPTWKGAKYRVDLKPSEDEYLLWDKPLSEQSEKVRKAIAHLVNDTESMASLKNYNSNDFGETLYTGLVRNEPTTLRIYNTGFAYPDSTFASQSFDKVVSEYLKSLGIRGIKYLDGTSRNRPLKDIKKALLSELPEDADFDEVLDISTFDDKQKAFLNALADDDWFGFDYPAQAISAALGNSRTDFDPSPALITAINDLSEGASYNYVIFDDADVEIEEIFKSVTDDAKLPEDAKEAIANIGAKILNDGLMSDTEFDDKEFAKAIEKVFTKNYAPFTDEIIALSFDRLIEVRAEALKERMIAQMVEDGMSETEAKAETDKKLAEKKASARTRAQSIASIRKIANRFRRHKATVDAFEDKTDNADVIHAGIILTEIKPLSMNVLITMLQKELSLTPDRALQVAKEAKKLQDEIAADKKTAREEARKLMPGALEEERKIKQAQQVATRRMNDVLRAVTDDANLMKRFNNDFRAKPLLNHATQLFNAVQSVLPVAGTMSGEIYTDAWDTAIRAISRKMGRENELDGIAPNVGPMTMLMPYGYLFSNNRQLAEGILAAFPDEYFRMELGILPDVNLDVAEVRGSNVISKGLHKWFDKNQQLNEFLANITFAKKQEAHFRSLTFVATLDQLARNKNTTLKELLDTKRPEEAFTEAQIRYAVDKALRVTFAEQMDDRIGRTLKRSYDQLDHYLPVLLNPFVYARFTYTVTRAVINAHTFGVLDSETLGGSGYNTRSTAKGFYGLTAIGIGYALLAAFGGDDDKWHHLYVNGKENPPIDIRRFFPFSAYVYTAYLIKRYTEGRDVLSRETLGTTFAELAESYASFDPDQYGRSPGVGVITSLDSDTEGATIKASAKLLGNFMSGFLRFFRPIKMLTAQIDQDEASFRNYDKTAQDAFVGQLANNLPFISSMYNADKRTNPITGEALTEVMPLGKMVGLNFVNPMFVAPKSTPAAEQAKKLFPYSGPSSEMTPEEREAYTIRREFKEAVRKGEKKLTDLEPMIQKYTESGKLSARSAQILRKSLLTSDLIETLKARFSFGDEKDVKKIKQIWEMANPAEQTDLSALLKAKRDTARKNKDGKALQRAVELLKELGIK